MPRESPSNTTSNVVAAALLIYTLGLGLYGIRRSLWLDEAWVANSIRTPDIGGMFHYSEWLQTSPPLFLLLERLTVAVFGLSTVSLRIVPLALAMLAAVAMWAAARRVLSWPLAVVASALIVANPTVIEYSNTVKQYSGEVLASTLLLWAVSTTNYRWIFSMVLLTPLLAYSSMFLLPGIFLGMILSGETRGRIARLAAAAALEWAVLYLLLIRPNYSPELRAFWATDPGPTRTVLAAALISAAAALWLLWQRERSPFLWTAVFPVLLLAAASALNWYPVNPRTRLFALPCFLLLAGVAHALVRAVSRLVSTLACITAVLLGSYSLYRQTTAPRALPQEDYAAAVHYLHTHATPKDLLLIHPAAREGFRLYAAIDHWTPQATYGTTGWPCCARNHDALPGKSTKEAVLADLDAKIPPGFRGRIWLLYPTRPSHWTYVGLNEGDIWRSHVWSKGCPPGPYTALANLAINEMNCAP